MGRVERLERIVPNVVWRAKRLERRVPNIVVRVERLERTVPTVVGGELNVWNGAFQTLGAY